MDHRAGIEHLHLDVPLISTRQPVSANASKSSHPVSNRDDYIDTSRSVPFSWEAAPGVPKGPVTRTGSSKDDEARTPKPPPGRWHPPSRSDGGRRNSNADADKCSNGTSDDLVVLDRPVSSSESLYVAHRLRPGASRAPSFIMDRFLPVANALAAASLDMHWQQRRTPPPSSLLGCRLVELFPRSLKSVAACRFKCQTTPKITVVEAFAQRSRRISTSDGMSSEDGFSSKACKSPVWGLPLPTPVGRELGEQEWINIREEDW